MPNNPDIPESMREELSTWNNDKGIDLKSWVGCIGNFKLAVGYASIFWPRFIEFEDYILVDKFSPESIRGFEAQEGSTPKSVEWVINHLNIADIQYVGCPDISRDKLIVIGNTLKEIYQAKLKFDFPTKPCIVEFYHPEDPEDLMEYQISFWQVKHELKKK